MLIWFVYITFRCGTQQDRLRSTDMPTTSRADGGAHDALGEPDAPADAVVDAADGANGAPGKQASPPRFWSTPAFMIIAAATVIGLALRAFLLFTPGFLTSGTVEYDD